ncbi:MAG: adenylate cyclase [Marivirga sp.]
MAYGEKAKTLAQKIKFEKGLAVANKNIGLGYYMKGDFVKVLSYWEESLKSFQNSNDKAGVANLYSNIGAVYFAFGDDALTLQYYLKALKVAEEIDDKLRIYTALVNIGTLYLNKEETLDKAMSYFNKTLPYLPYIEDKQSIGTLLTNLGELWMKKGNYDSSIYYLDKALTIHEGTVLYPHPLMVKGKVLAKQGAIVAAIALQKEAIEITEQTGQKNLLSQGLIALSESYSLQGKHQEAINTLNRAETLSEVLEDNYQLKDIYRFQSDNYVAISDFQEAYRYMDFHTKMKDTIYNIETNDKIKGLQFSYQMEKKEDEIELLNASNEIQLLETKRQRAISWGAVIAGLLVLILTLGIYRRYKFINKVKAILEEEKDRSDKLLLNILPEETAEELKEKGFTEPKFYDSATILFTDFKGFTSISAAMTPNELVSELHECFMNFDNIMSKYGLEKIKTIGDAYMAAGGLPKVNQTHPTNVALAALEIRSYMNQHKKEKESEGKAFFEVRVGINTGPVVSGVVGIKKFAYDIWGDTVNIAARMESSSEAGRVNISEHTYQLIKDKFNCEYRGEIEAKNAGKLKMYFLNDVLDGKLEPLEEKDTLLSN